MRAEVGFIVSPHKQKSPKALVTLERFGNNRGDRDNPSWQWRCQKTLSDAAEVTSEEVVLYLCAARSAFVNSFFRSTAIFPARSPRRGVQAEAAPPPSSATGAAGSVR